MSTRSVSWWAVGRQPWGSRVGGRRRTVVTREPTEYRRIEERRDVDAL